MNHEYLRKYSNELQQRVAVLKKDIAEKTLLREQSLVAYNKANSRIEQMDPLVKCVRKKRGNVLDGTYDNEINYLIQSHSHILSAGFEMKQLITNNERLDNDIDQCIKDFKNSNLTRQSILISGETHVVALTLGRDNYGKFYYQFRDSNAERDRASQEELNCGEQYENIFNRIKGQFDKEHFEWWNMMPNTPIQKYGSCAMHSWVNGMLGLGYSPETLGYNSNYIEKEEYMEAWLGEKKQENRQNIIREYKACEVELMSSIDNYHTLETPIRELNAELKAVERELSVANQNLVEAEAAAAAVEYAQQLQNYYVQQWQNYYAQQNNYNPYPVQQQHAHNHWQQGFGQNVIAVGGNGYGYGYN